MQKVKFSLKKNFPMQQRKKNKKIKISKKIKNRTIYFNYILDSFVLF